MRDRADQRWSKHQQKRQRTLRNALENARGRSRRREFLRVHARLVQFLFKTNHSLFEPAQPFGLVSFENRVSLDKPLLQAQLVGQTVGIAVPHFGGKDPLGTRDRLARLFVTRVENHLAELAFDLVREFSHGIARRTAVRVEFHRVYGQRRTEVEQRRTTEACFRRVVKTGGNDLQILDLAG